MRSEATYRQRHFFDGLGAKVLWWVYDIPCSGTMMSGEWLARARTLSSASCLELSSRGIAIEHDWNIENHYALLFCWLWWYIFLIIILKLRNIKDLWDCDSDAPEILPPSCHMPSPWPGLSGTSVLLRQPTWIYSSSTPEPFNNLCQKRSQTFTDVHRCSEVKTCSDWNEASLFHFISGCCFLFASEFTFFMLVRSQSAGLQKMPSADAAVHLDTSRWESGRLRCQPEQASRLENIASAREATWSKHQNIEPTLLIRVVQSLHFIWINRWACRMQPIET